MRARAGLVRNPPASPSPSRAASRTAWGSSTPRSGSTSHSAVRASPRSPTGRSTVSAGPAVLAGRVLAVPGDVDLHPPPAAPAPQQALLEHDGLDAPGRHGLGAGLEEAVPQPDAVGRDGGAEAELAGEAAPHEAAETEDHRDEPEDRGERAGDHHQDGQARHDQDEEDGRAGQQQRADDPARRAPAAARARGRRAPGRARRPAAAGAPTSTPGGAGHDLVAQLLGLRLAQVAEDDVGLPAAGRLHAHLGQPEQAAQERLDDVDGLDPVEAGVALLAEQDAGVQVDRLGGDGEAHAPPREHGVHARQERDDARGRRRRRAPRAPGNAATVSHTSAGRFPIWSVAW